MFVLKRVARINYVFILSCKHLSDEKHVCHKSSEISIADRIAPGLTLLARISKSALLTVLPLD
jgi:hypothetical protein